MFGSSKNVSTALGAEHLMLIMPNEEGELEANAMETFFQACATDEPFSLELVGTRTDQGFVLRASSAEQLVLLSKQLSAHYPQAELSRIAPAKDPLRIHTSELAAIGDFALAQKPWLPLKTFSGKTLSEPGADPLAGILAAMEPLGPGQRCVVQLALVRAPDRWISRYLRKSVEHPLQKERDALSQQSKYHTEGRREESKTILLIGALFGGWLLFRWFAAHDWLHLILLLAALFAAGLGWLWWKIAHTQQEIYDMKLVAEKLSRQAFYCHLRVIVIGLDTPLAQTQLQAHIKRLEVAYRQFALTSANSLVLKHISCVTRAQRRGKHLPEVRSAFPYQHPLLKFIYAGAPGPDICNSLELAGLFHLPQAFTDLPLVRRLSIKHLLASPEIAASIEQEHAPLAPALIGYSRHRGYSVPVYLPFETLFAHKFLVARSRYGKSTLIQLLACAAMQPVRDGTPQPGLFIIDPHRDLIEDLLQSIPAARARDVILLDLTDTQRVVALNPLDATMGFTRDQAVANLMASFERVWSDFWGPRMAYFLKAICLLLYTLNEHRVQAGRPQAQYTLLDINPLLQSPDYAVQVLDELDLSETWQKELLSWWQNVYFALPKQSSFRSEVIMPIVTKIGVFQDNQQLRRIVGQPVTHAPLHLAVTEGKIVLCALSSRDMDDAAVNVLGSTLINLLHRSFRLQEQVPLLERRRVFCAVDEFHAFSGGDYDRLLSEDGKFGCSMLLATQNLRRLNKIRDGLLEMVFSTCDNLFAFNVSAQDGKLLEDELRHMVEQKHIISQPRLHCYARLAIPAYPLQIVSVALARPPSWQGHGFQQQQAEVIRLQNRRQNASAQEIDERYAQHMALYLNVEEFAQKVHRDAQARRESRNEQQEAEQRAEHIRQQSDPSKEPGTSSDDTPAGIGSSLAGGTSAPGTKTVQKEAADEAKRNHPRSKRKAPKDEVGAAPPTKSDRSLLQGGLGFGSSRGSERERGE